jgi:uncharacterized membrane protein
MEAFTLDSSFGSQVFESSGIIFHGALELVTLMTLWQHNI